ncbi:sodium-dependent bicarbonate transport family permease [Isosphaeraceae bacterium EP7]
MAMLHDFWENFRHNLFKPLLLFFYMGFLVPILGVELDFPHVIYQGLTIYLLLAIGWKGGEELAELAGSKLGEAASFMGVGFVTNFIIGIAAYFALRAFTRLRKIDAATVAGYYGSDSAGTFVTCVGVLTSINMAYDAYMPVMLAIMEIPGCLVALYLVSRLRNEGMDALGNMPFEPGYNPNAKPIVLEHLGHGHVHDVSEAEAERREQLLAEDALSLQTNGNQSKPKKGFSPELLHEVFLNPGLYLLFGGIIIGFIARKQGEKVTHDDDNLFLSLFQGLLCLFLLEMGMTASKKLKDLRAAGWPFIAFALIAPNVFATFGICVAHAYCLFTGHQLEPGTYVIFAVLCGAASYIAVPAVQRLAIPEASPTLPLAASLGLTFSYNVTIGIPVYIQIAKLVTAAFPHS